MPQADLFSFSVPSGPSHCPLESETALKRVKLPSREWHCPQENDTALKRVTLPTLKSTDVKHSSSCKKLIFPVTEEILQHKRGYCLHQFCHILNKQLQYMTRTELIISDTAPSSANKLAYSSSSYMLLYALHILLFNFSILLKVYIILLNIFF